MAIRAVVTDIEGTTTPIDFVAKTLFPYAKQALPGFVATQGKRLDVAAELAAARELAGEPGLSDSETVALLLRWIDEDRKATPLKALQGMVWADGYAQGAFIADLYDDVLPALEGWKAAGLRLFCYSSGSVAAQRLLFGHTDKGDVTEIFEGFFDTKIGGKLEQSSYEALASKIGLPGPEILFLSDHPGELDAARDAGFATACLQRDDVSRGGDHEVFGDFTAVDRRFLA